MDHTPTRSRLWMAPALAAHLICGPVLGEQLDGEAPDQDAPEDAGPEQEDWYELDEPDRPAPAQAQDDSAMSDSAAVQDMPYPRYDPGLVDDGPAGPAPANYKDNPFFDIAVGIGYFHPLSEVGRRYGQGYSTAIQLVVFGEQLGLGLDMRWQLSQTTDEGVVIPAGLEGNDQPLALGTNPEARQFGLIAKYALVRTEHWFVNIGAAAGYRWYSFKFDGEEDLGGYYDDYRRYRRGLGVREDISVYLLWHLVPTLGVGPALTLSLTEALTWDVDGVQPDLGREDGADYGVELWPEAMLCLVLISSPREDPAVKARIQAQRPVYRHRYRTDMSAGYAHPLGAIGDHYPPGAAINFHHAFRISWMEIGLDMVVEPSFDSSDRIVLAQGDEDNPHTRPWKLESHPFMLNASLVFNPLVIYLGDWMLVGGIRLGAGYHGIGHSKPATTPDGAEYDADGYWRKWVGIVVGQHLELHYYPPLGEMTGHAGFAVRLRLDEMYTWNADEDKPKLGDPDPATYGLEWWPAILGGLAFRF